jgi:hypothetical protein
MHRLLPGLLDCLMFLLLRLLFCAPRLGPWSSVQIACVANGSAVIASFSGNGPSASAVFCLLFVRLDRVLHIFIVEWCD